LSSKLFISVFASADLRCSEGSVYEGRGRIPTFPPFDEPKYALLKVDSSVGLTSIDCQLQLYSTLLKLEPSCPLKVFDSDAI
jgi:hypothetical protein